MKKTILKARYAVISFIVLIALWQLLYTVSDFNEALFPSPFKALRALIELASDGTLFRHIGTSLYRFAAGYCSAVVSAVLLGLVLGWFSKAFRFVDPIVQLLRPISPTAWMPFIVLWFGIGDVPAIVIIFIAGFFPVLLTTVAAVANIDPIYLKVSRSFGIRQPQLMWKVIFPAAFPQIASGIHLALGTSWIFLVAGEMVGAQSGVGYLIIDARNDLRTDILLADIVVIGLIGLILDTLLKMAEKRILRAWGGAA